MDKNVYVYADEPVTVMWDGKEYELGDTPVEVKQGIAEHWQERHEGVRFEDIPEGVIAERIPENPLENNDRGQAFAALKNVPSKEETKALRAKGKELGIKGAHNMNIDALQAEIAKLEGKE